MKEAIKPLSLEGIKTYSLKGRKSLVSWQNFARPVRAPASFKKFLGSLPNILAAKDFKEIVERIQKAHQKGK
ncbi:MAG: hypothetical protein MUP68_06195, partial [Deltaproteobacteria bacterium]|nr:hypothetical protein [Deltaproteobacteria bacterium]